MTLSPITYNQETVHDGRAISSQRPTVGGSLSSNFMVPGVVIALVSCVVLAIWFCLDHGYPSWDGAAHVFDSQQYADLWKRPCFWKRSWLHAFFTVNYCYPPTIHAINGAFKAVLGTGAWSDHLPLIVSDFMLTLSLYFIALKTTGSRLSAGCAAGIINLLPVVTALSHVPMLDFHHLTWNAVALASMLWWRERPSWKHTLALSLALVLAATSKQIAPFFLAGPGLLLVWEAIRDRDVSRLLKLGAGASAVCFSLALWVVPHHEEIFAYMHRNSGLLASTDRLTIVGSNFSGYLSGALQVASPLFAIVALIALAHLALTKKLSSQWWLVLAGGPPGVLLMSVLSFQLPEYRYEVTLAVSAAVLAGSLCGSLIRSPRYRLAGAAIMCLGLLQYVSLNFCPPLLPGMSGLARTLGITVASASLTTRALPDGKSIVEYSPSEIIQNGLRTAAQPESDPHGQQWLIEEISRSTSAGETYVALMPNTAALNVHTLNLAALRMHKPLRFSTLRLWTPAGDDFQFEAIKLEYYGWFVLSDGNQGLSLRDTRAALEYARACAFIRTSTRFKVFAHRLLPGGETLTIFARRN